MRSNKIIFVCLIIFTCVALIGSYAGYHTTGIDQTDNVTENDNPYDTTTNDWWGFKDFFEWHTYTEAWPAIFWGLRNLTHDVPVIGQVLDSIDYVSGLLLFEVDGIPDWLSIFFWLLLFILGLAIARVIGGIITGGGD